jgi:hypothetical protein
VFAYILLYRHTNRKDIRTMDFCTESSRLNSYCMRIGKNSTISFNHCVSSRQFPRGGYLQKQGQDKIQVRRDRAERTAITSYPLTSLTTMSRLTHALMPLDVSSAPSSTSAACHRQPALLPQHSAELQEAREGSDLPAPRAACPPPGACTANYG